MRSLHTKHTSIWAFLHISHYGPVQSKCPPHWRSKKKRSINRCSFFPNHLMWNNIIFLTMLPTFFQTKHSTLIQSFVLLVFLFYYCKELLPQIYRGTHMLEIKLVTIIRRQILIVRASAGTVFSLFLSSLTKIWQWLCMANLFNEWLIQEERIMANCHTHIVPILTWIYIIILW